jgi:beta-phosphoglucomutase
MTCPQALLFDLDGVLIDSEPLHARNWVEMFRDRGIAFPEDEIGRFIGLRGQDLLEWLRARNPAAARLDMAELLEDKRRRFLESLGKDAPPVAGAESFLRESRAARRRLGLVTSARLRTIGQVLAHYGWRNTFDVVVGGDHVTRLKPHPEPYRQALERLRVGADTAVAFEDSIPGVRSAHAAGVAVCAVATSHDAEALRAAGARWVIRDFTQRRTLEEALE